MLTSQTEWPRDKYPTQTPNVRVFPSVSSPISSQLQLVTGEHRLGNQQLLFTPLLAFFLFFNFRSFRNKKKKIPWVFFFFFRSASVLTASEQILPYLLEGLRPWEPSKGQVEELLTLSYQAKNHFFYQSNPT